MQIAFDVRPRHTLEIVFATSNARIGKELSAGEVFWLRSGASMEKFDLAQKNKNGFAQTSTNCLLESTFCLLE